MKIPFFGWCLYKPLQSPWAGIHTGYFLRNSEIQQIILDSFYQMKKNWYPLQEDHSAPQ